ncbi:interleukin 17 receptor A1a [Pempheris klunzingeri]|uniref:interleukin 17 receptor A1a n=1 Tax=Pempheris klunzingeri TaxID=3127111 RepID=UPI00397F9117
MLVNRAVLWLLCVPLSSALRILTVPPLNCSQQGLRCTVSISNCMDSRWLHVHEYTPSSPEELRVSVETRKDDTGHLQPVLVANWKIKDDGSISYLNATEIHVLVTPTNQNLCVRYSFKDKLPMRSPSGEKWSFWADMLVLDPGQTYHISVFNIPKPELNHSHYDVSIDITVLGCQAPAMRKTQFCIERGSLWHPNISVAQVTAASGRSALAVSFSPYRFCEEYMVIVSCSGTQDVEHTYKGNQTILNVAFSLDKWPRSCCQFDVQIKPVCPQCGQDCSRRKTTLDICVKPTDAPDVPPNTFVHLGVPFICVVMAVIAYVLCRKPRKTGVPVAPEGGKKPWQQQLKPPPKVLVIYSQDHHFYRDIVLKLCAFLQAKCGTKVLVDLLDSTSVGMVGRLRWLEWQRQQLKNRSDKILVLCSRGVQAKWRAMCGQGRVTLKEDVLSTTDDMLTPFLNLFLPDMHHAGMLGKYMVAYFDDISSEQDVPSVFDIAVKYKLMKHFEELYFRILDIEKYQPGQVNHIEGIGVDEYFNCPSGRALKNAIETFEAYQLENPDWFERECVDGEEELMTNLPTDNLPPVLECIPLIRDGLPVCIHEVEINEKSNSGHVLTPELNTEHRLLSVVDLTPAANPEFKHQYPSHLGEESTGGLHLHSPRTESIYVVESVLNKPTGPRQTWLSLKEEPLGQIPTEDEEDDSLLPITQFSVPLHCQSSALQSSLYSNPPESTNVNVESECFPPSEISLSQPVEMEEYEVLEPSGKGQSSGSDQGYISKMSSQHEPHAEEDPLVALRRLQEELLQQHLSYSDMDPEGN